MSNPNLNQRFADAVTTLRAKGVIRYDSDIARDLGHSKGNISNYINGKLQPSEKFLEQFYNYYNKVLEHDKLDSIDITTPPKTKPTNTQGDSTNHILNLENTIKNQQALLNQQMETIKALTMALQSVSGTPPASVVSRGSKREITKD